MRALICVLWIKYSCRKNALSNSIPSSLTAMVEVGLEHVNDRPHKFFNVMFVLVLIVGMALSDTG